MSYPEEYQQVFQEVVDLAGTDEILHYIPDILRNYGEPHYIGRKKLAGLIHISTLKSEKTLRLIRAIAKAKNIPFTPVGTPPVPKRGGDNPKSGEIKYANDETNRGIYKGDKLEKINGKRGFEVASESLRIKTLDQLIETGEIDTDIWGIDSYRENSWEGFFKKPDGSVGIVQLFQVRAQVVRKHFEKPDPEYYQKWFEEWNKDVKKAKFKTVKSGKDVVVIIGDLHNGALIEGEGFVPDYNMKECEARLMYIADYVNRKYPGRPVRIVFLGDFIESFTGNNKPNTWKQIESHGAELVLSTTETLKKFFYAIDRLVDVFFIGGNHDRITDKKEQDSRGQVAQLIAGTFTNFTNLKIHFHHRVLNPTIDKVKYIFTHGDKRITKMLPSKLIMEYGDQRLFNVMVNAHNHQEQVHDDSIRYTSFGIPSVVVPNDYALDNGWSSMSGFAVCERGERGFIEKRIVPL
jgi:UDP-2,3-diacylglucosamine pyrophosphatase LpxH